MRSLFYLKPKFQASSHLMWLYSPVCVGPGRKPRRRFSHNKAHIILFCPLKSAPELITLLKEHSCQFYFLHTAICGSKLFNPLAYTCCEGTIRPGHNKHCCGTKAFNPWAYTCCEGTLNPGNSMHCCGTKAFNPWAKTCCSGKLNPGSNKHCCGTKAYNLLTYTCCNGTLNLGSNKRCCGNRAYRSSTGRCL